MFASSWRAGVGVAERALPILAFVSLLGAGLASARAQEPVPGSSLDLKFPLLPVRSFEIEHRPEGKLQVGDRLNAVLSLADSGDPAGDEVELVTPPGQPTLLKEGISFAERKEPAPGVVQVVIVPLRPGSIQVPALGLRKKGETEYFARTEPFALGVVDPLPGEVDQPTEFFGAVSLKFPLWLIILAGLVALALALGIVYGIYRLARRMRPRSLPEIPAGPPKSEDETALEALRLLQGKNLATRGAFKELHFGVSDILKQYLGARYRFDALESTTSELMRELESHHAGDTVVDAVETLYERLDLVKFTDHKPSIGECDQALEEARRIVTSTRRPPPVLLKEARP
ncbi:MAG: hypothetical protein IT285_03325 [Bdellovibrionales bacterium]|nr:hypothetical protein [Bdellovibrionales bacterium]